MTIALDGTPLTVPTGGVARYTSELARALAMHFPEDQYWLVSDQPFPLPESAAPNLHHGSLPHTLAARKWWAWGVQAEMTLRGADLFHGTDFSVPYLPLRPSVMTLHDLSPWLDRAWQPSARRVRRRTPVLLRTGLATMVITPSEAIRRAAIDRFHLPADRVTTVPLAASESFRPAAREPAATPYFLFVGTLEPRKNLIGLIEAWREVRKTRRVDLVLAGRCRADFVGPSPEEGLSILGAVPESELAPLYSGASAVVYPSLYEGFGLPVLEAMQCGALVITSRDPAILEVTGGSAAVHVDAGDARALAAAMAAAVDSPGHFAGIRARALDRAGQFSWKATAERTRDVYEQARRIFRR